MNTTPNRRPPRRAYRAPVLKTVLHHTQTRAQMNVLLDIGGNPGMDAS